MNQPQLPYNVLALRPAPPPESILVAWLICFSEELRRVLPFELNERGEPALVF